MGSRWFSASGHCCYWPGGRQVLWHGPIILPGSITVTLVFLLCNVPDLYFQATLLSFSCKDHVCLLCKYLLHSSIAAFERLTTSVLARSCLVSAAAWFFPIVLRPPPLLTSSFFWCSEWFGSPQHTVHTSISPQLPFYTPSFSKFICFFPILRNLFLYDFWCALPFITTVVVVKAEGRMHECSLRWHLILSWCLYACPAVLWLGMTRSAETCV